MSIYEDIGFERIAAIVGDFYARAFQDPMLAHFFLPFDQRHLTAMQIDFVCSMLGGPQSYQGKALAQAHDKLLIRPPHFQRRQRILQETMQDHGLEESLQAAWLRQEERLKPLIMKDQGACSD